jgi:hypothetical protein
MGVEALIELDEIDESFIREGMTVAFESLALYVRKLFCDILKFSRTPRSEMHVKREVDEILAFAKETENRVIERTRISNDLIEYKENKKWSIRSYNEWKRACAYKTLDPVINIYSKEQIYAENVNFFVDGPYEFQEN